MCRHEGTTRTRPVSSGIRVRRMSGSARGWWWLVVCWVATGFVSGGAFGCAVEKAWNLLAAVSVCMHGTGDARVSLAQALFSPKMVLGVPLWQTTTINLLCWFTARLIARNDTWLDRGSSGGGALTVESVAGAHLQYFEPASRRALHPFTLPPTLLPSLPVLHAVTNLLVLPASPQFHILWFGAEHRQFGRRLLPQLLYKHGGRYSRSAPLYSYVRQIGCVALFCSALVFRASPVSICLSHHNHPPPETWCNPSTCT